jgi:hypothetical protein
MFHGGDVGRTEYVCKSKGVVPVCPSSDDAGPGGAGGRGGAGGSGGAGGAGGSGAYPGGAGGGGAGGSGGLPGGAGGRGGAGGVGGGGDGGAIDSGTNLDAPAGQGWTQPPPMTAAVPTRRAGAALVYDASRGKLVLFGGAYSSTRYGDTWEWTPTSRSWEDRTKLAGPSSRQGHAMTYDAVRQRVLLFGGDDGSFRQDTWEWDGAAWTDVTPSGASPPPRQGGTMVYDVSRSRAVLFGGGERDGANPRQDTWEWDGVARTWTERTVSGAKPAARMGHAFAYDPIRKVAVLFGGSLGSAYTFDTWEWDGATGKWREGFSATEAPGPRVGATMVYAEAAARMVLVGGYGDKGTTLDEVWKRNGDSTWMSLGSAAPMPSRYDHAMAFDSVRGKVMVFGGVAVPTVGTNTYLNDLWEW